MKLTSLFVHSVLNLFVILTVLVTATILIGRTLFPRHQIAYISGEPPSLYNVYLMDVDRKLSRQITKNDLYLGSCCLSWSPDGKSLAVVSDKRPASIDVIDLDSLEVRMLTNSEPMDWAQSYSPDGKHIAYLSRREGGNDLPYVMDVDGSNQHRVTTEISQNIVLPPTWFIDGSKMFILDETNTLVTHSLDPMCKVQCSEPFLPPDLTIVPTTALLQIDNRRLLIAAFTGRDYTDFSMYILDRFKSNTLERLTNNSGVYPPSMAASGTWVAFVSGESNFKTESSYNHLYFLDTDCIGTSSGCASQLQQIDVVLTINSGLTVSWSPDGRWLTFVGAARDDGVYQLYILDTTCVRERHNCASFIQPLTQGSNWLSSPAWRP